MNFLRNYRDFLLKKEIPGSSVKTKLSFLVLLQQTAATMSWGQVQVAIVDGCYLCLPF